ncbi:MAG: PKD domain-containing protein, partial [Clostridia bacterium]|nr:PKD domain-containing protein [Clostridia bacterium]
ADPATGDFRLLPGSPCIDTGTNQAWMATATDLDGNDRILNTTVDIGAYEYAIGALDCSPNGEPVTGFLTNEVVFTAGVSGTNTTGPYYKWDFDNDGSYEEQGSNKKVVTNLYTPGLYSVRLVVTNDVAEVSERIRTGYIKVGPEIAYVAPDSTPAYPYTSWADAATNIQDAIDAGVDGTLVLVTNGVYLITSQIDLQKGITVRSINGYSNTVVQRASGACRIFYLSHSNAVLDGFTITNGYLNTAYIKGGGVLIDSGGGTVSNCLITGNICKFNSYGGGVFLNQNGRVKNCLICGNSGTWTGGGVHLKGTNAIVENCEIMENQCDGAGGGGYSGGGAYVDDGATLRNCLVYNNISSTTATKREEQAGGVYCDNGSLVESCTIVS